MCVFMFVGEIIKLTHVARGVDAEGVLLVDMVINGFIPPSLSSSLLHLQVWLQVSFCSSCCENCCSLDLNDGVVFVGL